ncbi:MAG: hypothetical protein R3F59_25765 [Myxococcota bacterium]
MVRARRRRRPPAARQAVARALGTPDAPRAALAELGDALLVLDRCEHLPGLGAELEGWLAAAPHLTVLATSRRRLGGRAEHLLEVPPLAPPDAEALLRRQAAAASAALPDDEPAVARIVALTGGVPLAIELAATRLRVLPPAALADRLAHPLDVLADPLAADPAHASLRAAIAASWALLSEAARRTLAQLTVFRSGFALEAAEAVVDAVAPGLPARRAPGARRQLDAPADGRPPRPYDSVQAFAAEHLPPTRPARSGLPRALARRPRPRPRLRARLRPGAPGLAARRVDNLAVATVERADPARAVLGHLPWPTPYRAPRPRGPRGPARRRPRPAPHRSSPAPFELRLAEADRLRVRPHIEPVRRVAELRGWVAEPPPDALVPPQAFLVEALFEVVAQLVPRDGDEEALAAATEARELVRDGPPRLRASAAAAVATAHYVRERYDEALPAYRDALQAAAEADDPLYRGALLHSLARLHAELGQVREAVALLHDAAALLTASRARTTHVELGYLAIELGDREAAVAAYDDLVAHKRAGLDPLDRVLLGNVALLDGDYDEADAAFAAEVAFLEARGIRTRLPFARRRLGAARRLAGRPADAVPVLVAGLPGASPRAAGRLEVELALCCADTGDPGRGAAHLDRAEGHAAGCRDALLAPLCEVARLRLQAAADPGAARRVDALVGWLRDHPADPLPQSLSVRTEVAILRAIG